MHFNIADLFEKVVDTVGEREALVHGQHRCTYTQLDHRANKLAHYLVTRGVKCGDHVGLYLYNCNEYLEAMLACFKIRAVPININYRYVKDELLYLFNNADMVACIHDSEFIPRIVDIYDNVNSLHTFIALGDNSDESLNSIGAVDYAQVIDSQSQERDFAPRSDDDLFILYTGGTTGKPKGVMWPHKSVFFAALGGGGYFSPLGACQSPDDIVARITDPAIIGMALAPLMHGASWWYACAQLLAGNKLILNPNRSLQGEQVWDICEREKCNAVQIVGDAMAIALLQALDENPGRWDLSALFNVGSGGAVFSQSKQQAFKKHFPDIFISNSFGSSESGQMGVVDKPKDNLVGFGNVMRSEFMDVIVVQEDGVARRAGQGEMGIFARAGYIPLGYYNDPEKTAASFVDVDGTTWLLTGDAATLEADNSITLFGRGSNCINTGGEKVYPEEVEQALKAHSEIVDALVFATPDERLGSKVTAVLSTRNNIALTLEQIKNDLNERIAGYKMPRELHFVISVPRLPNGKPDYQSARAIANGNTV